METREGLILPPGEDRHPGHLPPVGTSRSEEPLLAPEQPHAYIASNSYVGTFFLIAILVVFISTHAPLRGLWEWVAVLFMALVVAVIALYGLWGTIRDW